MSFLNSIPLKLAENSVACTAVIVDNEVLVAAGSLVLLLERLL